MRGLTDNGFMSNESALGTGKTDGQDVLERIINNNIVIFHWQEKRVSDNVAQISIVGCEDSSLPVLTFRATGFATTFKTPQHAEAFVVSNSWIHSRWKCSRRRLHPRPFDCRTTSIASRAKTNQPANDTELRTHICQLRHI